MKFVTRQFGIREVTRGEVDRWMNSFLDAAHGAAIAGMTSCTFGDSHYIVIVLKVWNRQDGALGATPVRATIDEIPEEPSIQVDEPEL